MDGFRLIVPPRGHFYADPFLLEWKGKHYLFFEDYSFASRRGRISYCELFDDLLTTLPAVALEREYHLSYPFLFLDGGVVHMIPDTSDRRTVELYHAPDFPGEFMFKCKLMADVIAIDPTVIKLGERFWLFANDFPDDGGPYDRLNLFWSDALLGPWHAHPRSPVVRDIGRARPAGALLRLGGELIRPSQDCSQRYGQAVVFNRITRLDPEGYEEEEIGRMEPSWLADNAATHAYNRTDRFEVIDGQWLTFESQWVDLAIGTAARLLNLPTTSAIRGRRGWKEERKAGVQSTCNRLTDSPD
jgi:hypothetical protein